MTRQRLTAALAVVLAALLVTSGTYLTSRHLFGPKTITAIFTTTTSIYPGDDVRVAGVKVGTITAIQPDGPQAKMVMSVDHDVTVPGDARAVIVAQNLISARYVQLAPVYQSGPTMADGALIPLERTAVPVEWDEVKDQLNRLATDLGPQTNVSGTSIARFLDSTADALAGNGVKFRQTLAQLSGLSRLIANGSGDIVDIVKNLQTFVTVLRDSNAQAVQFQDRLASLSSVLNGGRSDLDSALTDLAAAVGDVRRFVSESRDQTSEQVQRLTNVTQNLVDHRMDLEQVLHVTPTALANAYNIFDPRTGAAGGAFVVDNFSNPVGFLCDMIGAIENVTGPETAKLCTDYLGPGLRKVNFNEVPFPVNPVLEAVPTPDKLIYSEPQLAPGGAPDAANPPPSLPDMLLPAEGPPS
jgi:phospholipid/cholesterol/gamma-HCH transport system substrate-binding protein